MPKLGFGEKTHFDGRTQFLELKSKGDEIHVRFLGSAVYDGKHFIKNDDGSWTVSYCPRIMQEKDCTFCERFFELKKAAKALGDPKTLNKTDKKTYDEYQAEARKYNASISFYYPVLDREAKTARVFKTGLSIRSELDKEHDAGIPILEFDYKIKRLKGKMTDPGKDWYAVTRLDSKMIEPLTEEEEKAKGSTKEWDLEDIVYGSKKSSMDLAASPEAESAGGKEEVDKSEPKGKENINPKDLPF